jgi:hypothetical protein
VSLVLPAADGDVKVLRTIARKLLDRAIEGDLAAITSVADRLDGKPAQESTVTVDSKRDASDWSRDELVAFLNDHRAGSNEPN